MGDPPMYQTEPDGTSATLLSRLRDQPADPAAWQEFVRRYRPRIVSFCLGCRLQPADAEDVAQAVLLRLVARLPEFRYDPSRSFRAWLTTVARRVLCDYVSQRQREQGSGDTAVLLLLDSVE